MILSDGEVLLHARRVVYDLPPGALLAAVGVVAVAAEEAVVTKLARANRNFSLNTFGYNNNIVFSPLIWIK